MSKVLRSAVGIVPGCHKATLSKGQKTFNSLIKQIEKRRARLRAWDEVTPVYQKRYVNELLPLENELAELEVKLVHRLDEISGRKGLTKAEQRTLSEAIVGCAGGLLEECDDAQLKAIYNRHGRTDYDSDVAADLEDMKAVVEEMFGFELGDDLDLNSTDDLVEHMRAKMHAQQAEEEARAQVREARRAKRKKSAKQAAAEIARDAEQAAVGQSIREVYRKLASTLHPDREPDQQERERKTALMQRVNQAYGRNDLLQLLELQLELEHIDQAAINDIGEGRLKHYNKILKGQLGELDQEILHVETGFRHAFGLSPFIDMAPDMVVFGLEQDVAELRRAVLERKSDLSALDDPKQLKSWLKRVKQQQDDIDFDDSFF